MKPRIAGLLPLILGLLVGLLVFGDRPHALALPEYSDRTGETCATCHVNPAGGGPRTARGLLWVAAGRPDKVPPAPAAAAEDEAAADAAATPGAAGATSDGQALYDRLACSGCHGTGGEGGPAPALNVPAAVETAEQAIREGRDGMPGYSAAVLPAEDLARLVRYLRALANGGDMQQADPAARPAANLTCGGADEVPAAPDCGGN